MRISMLDLPVFCQKMRGLVEWRPMSTCMVWSIRLSRTTGHSKERRNMWELSKWLSQHLCSIRIFLKASKLKNLVCISSVFLSRFPLLFLVGSTHIHPIYLKKSALRDVIKNKKAYVGSFQFSRNNNQTNKHTTKNITSCFL